VTALGAQTTWLLYVVPVDLEGIVRLGCRPRAGQGEGITVAEPVTRMTTKALSGREGFRLSR
jgi:hypothetical protein